MHNQEIEGKFVMGENKNHSLQQKDIPVQRKPTLKWERDGELSAIDMSRILNRLSKTKLTECDLACHIRQKEKKRCFLQNKIFSLQQINLNIDQPIYESNYEIIL